MVISPIMEQAAISEEELLSPIAAVAAPPIPDLSPLWGPVPMEEDLPNSPPPLSPVRGGTISPIHGARPLVKAPRLVSGGTPTRPGPPNRAHSPDRVDLPDRADSPDRTDSPDRDDSPDLANSPDRDNSPELLRPPNASNFTAPRKPASIDNVSGRWIAPAASASGTASSIAPRPRASEPPSSSSTYREAMQAHVLESAALLNQYSSRHLAYLRIERGALQAALDAAQGYRMHCATIDWATWCIYNDQLERVAESWNPDTV